MSMSFSSAARSAESSAALLLSLLIFLRGGKEPEVSNTLSNIRFLVIAGRGVSSTSRGCIANYRSALRMRGNNH